MVTEAACIIYSYIQNKNYAYLHIPQRLVKECGITSGGRFFALVRNGRLVLEQEKKEVTDGTT